MAIAAKPSVASMPIKPAAGATVLDFLCQKFPRISAEQWRQRMAEGKVHRDDGSLYTPQCCVVSQQRVLYYREVPAEPVIPFQEQILFEDELLLVACKPHFLPVIPSGPYVNECLLNRLCKRTGLDQLVLAHRIDRETAGLVLCCKQPEHRAAYQRLFATGNIRKQYHAVAAVGGQIQPGMQWQVRNRLEKGEPWFRMQVVDGQPNSDSSIECLTVEQGRGLFSLSPHTGKTHQLRLHMHSLGMALENDRLYPVLQDKTPDNYDRPLQLLARQIDFIDPVTGEPRHFETPRTLQF